MSLLTRSENLADRYDVVVVGSGAAGTTAALRAARAGLTVAILEKAALLGGTTCAGGGVMWAPGNHLMDHAGWSDSPEQAKAYLERATHGAMSAQEIDWYVRTAPEAVRWLDKNTRVRFVPLGRPDYHRQWPGSTSGGRGLDNAPFDPAVLTGLADRLRPPTYFPLLTMEERDRLGGRAPDPDLLEERSARGIRTMGGALSGALIASAVEAGADVVTHTPVTDLHRDRLTGTWEIDAGHGTVRAESVVLASGGFEWDPELRDSLLPFPITPISAPSNQGDGFYLGIQAGAAVAQTGSMWGVPVVTAHGGVYDGIASGRMFNVEMTLPGSITVNAKGHRFVNEALNYHDLSRVFANVDPETGQQANRPAWMVFDSTYLAKYSVAGAPAGQPQEWMSRADTLDGLAELLGMDPGGLTGTIQTFNRDALRGHDSQFGRGATEQDRHLGDSTVTPNPCLAPLDSPPFYAVPVHAGVLGTAGGLRTNLCGQVLDRVGVEIPGLYAAGNCSATIFHNAYPGGGATIGAAITRGFAAGTHLAGLHER